MHLVGKASFITSKDNKRYNSTCCAVVQYQKGTFIHNGKSYPTDQGGGRLDGHWHIDNLPWSTDQPENADTVDIESYEALDTGEFVWIRGYDRPGASGFSVGGTFDSHESFQWKAFDRCNKWKLVKTSNTVSDHIWGVWPDFNYQYSR